MGYTTEFYGTFSVEPPLNEAEREYLNLFSDTRRMLRHNGPYYAVDDGNFGQDWGAADDVMDRNKPPACQPGLWCQWVPTEEGAGIEWNGAEKFYHAAEWIEYLIEHFLKPDCIAKQAEPEKFKDFVPHVVSGQVIAQGEEQGDTWRITIKDNVVTTQTAQVVFEEE